MANLHKLVSSIKFTCLYVLVFLSVGLFFSNSAAASTYGCGPYNGSAYQQNCPPAAQSTKKTGTSAGSGSGDTSTTSDTTNATENNSNENSNVDLQLNSGNEATTQPNGKTSSGKSLGIVFSIILILIGMGFALFIFFKRRRSRSADNFNPPTVVPPQV